MTRWLVEEDKHEDIGKIIDLKNSKDIKQYMACCKEYTNNHPKIQFIGYLYDVYRDDVEVNYNVLKLVQYVTSIDNDTFKREFSDNNEELKQIAQCITDDVIRSNN